MYQYGQPYAPAVVLKGLVEHDDEFAYFSGGNRTATETAVAHGWVTTGGTVTELGREVYENSGLSTMPSRWGSRADWWNWLGVDLRGYLVLPYDGG